MNNENNTGKFSGKAKNYSAGRPSYAKAFIDMLYAEQSFSASSEIADIGCGTGIFAKQLLERGSIVYGVELNGDMRLQAENYLAGFDNFRLVNGIAENTTLPDCSVDFITVAQAFHWFNVEPFKAESKRILRSCGKVFLIWNSRDTRAEVNKLCGKIFSKFCKNFKGFSGGIKKDDERISEFFNGKYCYAEFDNPLLYDREKFIRRSLSSSYSLTEKDKNFSEYLSKLNELFDKNSTNGVLTIPNKTEVYFTKL